MATATEGTIRSAARVALSVWRATGNEGTPEVKPSTAAFRELAFNLQRTPTQSEVDRMRALLRELS